MFVRAARRARDARARGGPAAPAGRRRGARPPQPPRGRHSGAFPLAQPARRLPTAQMAEQFRCVGFSALGQARERPARPPKLVASAGGVRHHLDPCLAGVWQGACALRACGRPAAAVPPVPAAVQMALVEGRLGRRRSRLVTVVAAAPPIASPAQVVLGAGRGPARSVSPPTELGAAGGANLSQSGSAGAV